MLPDAPLIEWWCAYAGINPQVMLTMLELDGRLSRGWPSHMTQEERAAFVEAAVMRLADSFYWHLYEYGERAARPNVASLRVPLADGSAVELGAISSGTYATVTSLAHDRTAAQFAQLTDASDAGSFARTWVRLFPESDPLDDAVSITPRALPPADLFQFPFPIGQTWWFNGAHNWNGSGATYGRPYSSMDFFTSANNCAAPPAGDWAVAAVDGSGYHPNGYGCWLRIDHAEGWTTSYYHLRNTISTGSVSANSKIGTIACETCAGGFATGPHVHFSLLYNGAYVDLDGVTLSGWTVRSGNGDYQSGGLERDGVLLTPYSTVFNGGIPGAPTPTPVRTPTPTASPIVTPSATPAGVTAKYLYPPVNALVRICPVKLVAEVSAPGGIKTVRFWARRGDIRQQIGVDGDGSDGWHTEWDCQDTPDAAASLALSAEDISGREIIHDAGITPVTIRKDCPDGTYRTAFFANPGLDAAPASSWCKASGISYAWGTGSPGAGVPGSDNFSARFRGRFWFDAGAYRFSGSSDDGVRVWVDRTLVVDHWRGAPGGAQPFQFARTLTAAQVEIRVDYFEEAGSAGVSLVWEKTGPPRFKTFLPLAFNQAR